MAAITSAVIGVASVAAGAYSANQTNKANEKAVKRANLNEKNRRVAAAEEMAAATEEYNRIRAQRPGLTAKDFLREVVQSQGDDELRAQFEQMSDQDFERAQLVADQASLDNAAGFQLITDALSGGKSLDMLQERNRIALGGNDVDAFNRAMQLRSSAIPAGTVRMDSQGRFVEGQRSDKQVFQTAYETSLANQDRSFSLLNSAIDSDRNIALRQQEKAKDFLGAGYGNIALGAAEAGLGNRLQNQRFDEAAQMAIIRDFQNAAFMDQTVQPVQQSTAQANALISGGLDLAARSLTAGTGSK